MSWVTLAFRRADFFLGFSLHEAFFPPLPPVPYYPHLSFGFVTGVTQLFSMPSCGNHKNITANGLHLMGRMTDAFPIVPHVSFPPQAGMVMTTLFGSSNMCWGSSSVTLRCWTVFSKHGEATDIATALGWCVSPHLACNEPLSAPFDLACVTDSTVMVGMSLGDFLACLVDIGIQLAMELGLKFLMAGAKSLYKELSSSKKILEADKFVKFDEAFDAVQAGKQADELVDHGWHMNEAAEAATKETSDLGKEAEKSGIYKYGAKQMAKKEEAETSIAIEKELQESYKQALEEGTISQSKYDELMKASDDTVIKARYTANEAGKKLETIDDAWYDTLWGQIKNSFSRTDKDALIQSTEESGTWSSWYNAYLDGSTEWYYKLYGCYDATCNFLQAWAKNGDSFFSLVLYSFFRRLTGRVGTIFSSLYKLMTVSDQDSENQNLFMYWGNRQDYIDEVNDYSSTDVPAITEEELEAALTAYERFSWVDPTVGSTGTTTRFAWSGDIGTSRHDQWADKTFKTGTSDRFAWVPVEEEEETTT